MRLTLTLPSLQPPTLIPTAAPALTLTPWTPPPTTTPTPTPLPPLPPLPPRPPSVMTEPCSHGTLHLFQPCRPRRPRRPRRRRRPRLYAAPRPDLCIGPRLYGAASVKIVGVGRGGSPRQSSSVLVAHVAHVALVAGPNVKQVLHTASVRLVTNLPLRRLPHRRPRCRPLVAALIAAL